MKYVFYYSHYADEEIKATQQKSKLNFWSVKPLKPMLIMHDHRTLEAPNPDILVNQLSSNILPSEAYKSGP